MENTKSYYKLQYLNLNIRYESIVWIHYKQNILDLTLTVNRSNIIFRYINNLSDIDIGFIIPNIFTNKFFIQWICYMMTFYVFNKICNYNFFFLIKLTRSSQAVIRKSRQPWVKCALEGIPRKPCPKLQTCSNNKVNRYQETK